MQHDNAKTKPCPICHKNYQLAGNPEKLNGLLNTLLRITRLSRLVLALSIIAIAAATAIHRPSPARPDLLNVSVSTFALLMVSAASTWLSLEWTIHQIHRRLTP